MFYMSLQSKCGSFLFLISSGAFLFWAFFGVIGILLGIYLASLLISITTLTSNLIITNQFAFFGIFLSAYGVLLTISVSFLYPGRLVFPKPPEILFTSVSNKSFSGDHISSLRKDAIIIPISCVNTGSKAKSLNFAVVASIENEEHFIKRIGFKYSVFTNDFRLENMPYSAWKTRRSDEGLKFEDVLDLRYMEPFTVGPRSSTKDICLFTPPEFPVSISLAKGKRIELYLYYREVSLGNRGAKKLNEYYRESCGKNGSNSPKNLSRNLNFGGWKAGFKIAKRIPLDIAYNYTKPGNALSVTRFEFHKHKSRWKVPVLLLCEDID